MMNVYGSLRYFPEPRALAAILRATEERLLEFKEQVGRRFAPAADLACDGFKAPPRWQWSA